MLTERHKELLSALIAAQVFVFEHACDDKDEKVRGALEEALEEILRLLSELRHIP